MPFKSKAQQRYLYATNPKVADKFAKETSKSSYKNLPEKVKKKRKREALKRMGGK
jgi:hypothetical protein